MESEHTFQPYLWESSSSLPLSSNDVGNRHVVVQIKTNDEGSVEYECTFQLWDVVGKSKYLEDRLSGNQTYVVVKCKESEIEHFKTVFELLLQVETDASSDANMLSGVNDTIGILEAAIHLECPQIITSCVEYLEAVPWTDEEMVEVYALVSDMGAQVEPILSRIKPVDSSVMTNVLHSAIKFITLSLPPALNDLKASVRKLLEKYMLNETNGDPLVSVDEATKKAVLPHVEKIFSNFSHRLDSFLEDGEVECLVSLIMDMCCAFQILEKFKSLRPIVCFWLENSEKMVSVLSNVQSNVELIKANLKVFELTAKILQAVGNGSVILSTAKRLGAVKVWLPFVSNTKVLMDSTDSCPEMDGEICGSLESAFNEVILTLPLGNQAEILNGWLSREKQFQYPNLIKAFEVWCSRSKYAMDIKLAWGSGIQMQDDLAN